jgi:hypothetical protein
MSVADELVAPDFVEHEELPPGIPRDREGVKQLATILRSAFPTSKPPLGSSPLKAGSNPLLSRRDLPVTKMKGLAFVYGYGH